VLSTTTHVAEIWNAEDKDHAQAAANVFAADYGTGWPKAAAKITDNFEVLLAFYDQDRDPATATRPRPPGAAAPLRPG
jgi:hypothetical protein